jgi:serine protease Do
MSFLVRHRIALMILIVVFAAGAPFAGAQTEGIPRVIQMNASGAYLGIQMDDVNSSNMSRYKLSAERGAIVRSVMKGSPAEDAGLKEDDVLLEFAGSQIWSAAQLSRLVQETPPGRKVDLVLSRDGKRMNMTVEIGTRAGRRAELRMEGMPGFDDRLFQWPPAPSVPRGPEAPGGKPRLGVTLQPLTDQLGEFLGVPGRKGVLVASVLSGSASAGKLKTGDVILSADGKSVSEPEDLTRIVREKTGGDMTFKVIRDKKEITVVVSLPAEERESKGYKL